MIQVEGDAAPPPQLPVTECSCCCVDLALPVAEFLPGGLSRLNGFVEGFPQPGELLIRGARLVQLFHSGLVKLPKSIRNLEAGALKACGHTFRQYLDRNANWQSLKASNPELTPYSLRHGYAWRAAKYYPQPLPLRDTAKLMGHDLKTQIRHYGQWTDDASTKSAVEASIQSLVGAS